MSLAAIADAAEAVGLIVRGGFVPRDGDGVPDWSDGTPVATAVMLGNAGGSLWPAFSTSAEFRDGAPHALDRWTRRVVDELAAGLGAEARYPFGGPPHWPFQRWAMRAEPVFPSPLGLLIHPTFGLWHAYRAALLFAAPVDLPAGSEAVSPCDTCEGQPCLATCPAAAFASSGYDVAACAAHIGSAAGAMCMTAGCRARAGCPVGAAHTYPPAQVEFHMAAFKYAHPS